jgi:hypothetical protein
MARNGKYNDISGERRGNLTIIKCVGKKNSHYLWECVCDCGNIIIVPVNNLNNGHTKSCGCLSVNTVVNRTTTHGNSKKGKWSPEYAVWSSIKGRCLNPNNPAYKNYGGRGIKICERWANSFENFLQDVGKRPSLRHSFDRYPDNNGNYEPGNFRWATKKQQADNRRTSRWYEYDGIKLVLEDWARKLGVSRSTLSNKLKKQSIDQFINELSGQPHIRHSFGYMI